MSENEWRKKDGKRKDKKLQAMRASSSPRKEQASVRYGEQELQTVTVGVAATELIL